MKPNTALRALPIPEVADRLGVDKRTVYRLIDTGRLRIVNVAVTGTRMRVREDDLNAYIEANTVDAPDEGLPA